MDGQQADRPLIGEEVATLTSDGSGLRGLLKSPPRSKRPNSIEGATNVKSYVDRRRWRCACCGRQNQSTELVSLYPDEGLG